MAGELALVLATLPFGWQHCLDEKGFLILPRVYSEQDVQRASDQLAECFRSLPEDSASIRSRGGNIYAARNFIELFPPAAEIWNRDCLRELLEQALGPSCGLVRALYFDKPPDRSWSLPWHRDLTIAVRGHQANSSRFVNPTMKAGVAHVEAPSDVLESMLTLRIHLDDATLENGALQVIPGSHCLDNTDCEQAAEPVLAQAGDVLVMRPLLSHCSACSNPLTKLHRRIIHLEFASSPELSDGFDWHTFKPVVAGIHKETHLLGDRN